jgi:hypothetical protein
LSIPDRPPFVEGGAGFEASERIEVATVPVVINKKEQQKNSNLTTQSLANRSGENKNILGT